MLNQIICFLIKYVVTIIHVLFDPFINFGFMFRAMLACVFLSVSITLVGGLLILKRMSLIGDALSHAILPGVAIGYFFSGMSCVSMGIGGFISGLIVAILSNWISDKTFSPKDASISGLYLGFLAFGIILMSLHKSDIDLLHVLFGSIFSMNIYSVRYIGVISTITLISIAILYRALIIEIFDSEFLKRDSIVLFKLIQWGFLLILVMNLIASFQVVGTLMSVGLMMLPGLSARYWVKGLLSMFLCSICFSILCSWLGLLGAFYISCPAGPAIVLCASMFFFVSALFGKNKGVFSFIYY